MRLTRLSLCNLRSFSSVEFDLHPRFNIFIGPNGSGKTTILEAVYLLSRGHSFRTREVKPLISHQSAYMTVTAEDNTQQIIHLYKSPNLPTMVKVNQTYCTKASELARLLPCQLIYQDLFQLVDAGPAVRRQILDWGLFHVEHTYADHLKQYQKCLKQRNLLLRQRASQEQISAWELPMSRYAEQLHRARDKYMVSLNKAFKSILSQLSPIECSLEYYKGWDRKETGVSLIKCLLEQRPQDYQMQYTHSGAHQADIQFKIPGSSAKKMLSRGQQKVLLIALKFAQTALVKSPFIYLFDDLCNELDDTHIQKILTYCSRKSGQFFITALNRKDICHWLSPEDMMVVTL